MFEEFQVGEKLVWIHIDDETGRRINDIVTVMGVRSYPSSAYYSIRVDSTGEVAMAWHDELRRYAEV